MLCDHLEGWDREGGRERDARGRRYGDICICIADSLCYKAETNTPLLSNYTPIKMLKKKRENRNVLANAGRQERSCFIQGTIHGLAVGAEHLSGARKDQERP